MCTIKELKLDEKICAFLKKKALERESSIETEIIAILGEAEELERTHPEFVILCKKFHLSCAKKIYSLVEDALESLEISNF